VSVSPISKISGFFQHQRALPVTVPVSVGALTGLEASSRSG
jgi:hypothetical protein